MDLLTVMLMVLVATEGGIIRTARRPDMGQSPQMRGREGSHETVCVVAVSLVRHLAPDVGWRLERLKGLSSLVSLATGSQQAAAAPPADQAGLRRRRRQAG